MDFQEALTLLELSSEASIEDLKQAYRDKKQGLTERLNAAPDSLKAKFKTNLEQLEQAFALLERSISKASESPVNVSDLPVAAKNIDLSVANGVVGALQSTYLVKEEVEAGDGYRCFKGETKADHKQVFLVVVEDELSSARQSKYAEALESLRDHGNYRCQTLLGFDISSSGMWLCYEALPDDLASLKSKPISDHKPLFMILRKISNLLNILGLENGHGDIHPGSILVAPDGEPYLARALVEGLGASRGSSSIHRAPELKRGMADAVKSDQYSIAVVALEMLSGGRIPTGGLATALENKGLNEAARACFKKALSANPSQRYRTIDDFITELEQSYVPLSEKLIRNKWLTIPTLILVVLIGVTFVFKSKVADVYEEHSADFTSDVDFQTASIKQLAESKDIVTKLEQFFADSKRKESRLEDKVLRANRSNNSAELRQLKDQQRQLLSQKDFMTNYGLPGDQFSDIKSSLVVVSQLVSGKEFEKAYELNEPIYEQLKSLRELLNSLDVITGYDKKVFELQSALVAKKDKSKWPEALVQNESILIAKKRMLASERKFSNLVNEVYEPLVELYSAEIERIQSERKARAQSQKNAFRESLLSQMVQIPAGTFKMGIVKAGATDARPVHSVTINKFSVSKYPVTNKLFNTYLAYTGKKSKRVSRKDSLPVVNVSWLEAIEFVKWLSSYSGDNYRLLSESEWEYIARSGIRGQFFWGNSIGKNNMNCARCGSQWDGASPSPVASFKANQFGVYDINGNVWEWVSDCYVAGYKNAPNNGASLDFKDCELRSVRGGAFDTKPKKLHPALRSAAPAKTRLPNLGFRIVQD